MAEGATVANAFVQIMPSMEGATSSISNALVPGMTSAGNTAGAQFGSVFAGKAGAALKVAGTALAGVFAVGALKDSFETVEAGFNNVKLATGATGEQAEALKNVYLDVSKSVSGSFEDIGSAVGEINTRLGLEGEALETASEQMMKYAKVTGQDATKATQDVASMMRNVGIPAEEMGTTLDKLTKAGQAAGIDVSSLANNVTKYNAVMKEMGFTTDEQIALMSQFEVSGADTASVLNAMKKGVANWAKEGKDAGEEFRKFVQGVQDGTVTSGDAVEIFGTKGGLSLYEAAQKGQLSFDDMYKAITEDSEGALDSVYQSTLTAQEKFDILGKNLQAGFFEILEPIVDALMPYIDGVISALTGIINGAVEVITPFVEEFSAQIAPVIDTLLPNLQSLFDEVMGDIGDIVAEVWPDMQKIITNVMKAITKLIELAWPAIKVIIETVMTGIKTVIQTVWPVISNIVETATGAISDAVEALAPLLNFIKSLFDGIKKAIEDPIGTAEKFISDAMSTIQGIFDRLDFSLPSIALPHFNVWGGEFPWGIGGAGAPPEFSVDWYGKGGFADEPTLSGYGDRGLEFNWPGYAPYFDMYAKGIAEHMPKSAGGVTINIENMVVREEADIRRVAVELNRLIDRQNEGALVA